MSWVRAAACFHSRRKYPSRRAWVFAEITGKNNAHDAICARIFASHASPPTSSLWSSHTSMPADRSASQTRRAASASWDA
jgi:hypothetical protein